MRAAAATLLGVANGMSHRPLSRAWFEAMAKDGAPEEVSELEFATNAAREEAAVLARHGIEP